MIRRFFCALVAVILLCGGAHAENMPGLVRLHVVADDNSASAQALKLALRDTCLDCARFCIADAPDSAAAYARLEQHVSDFQSACESRARQLGYTGPVTAETGIFEFPHRIYGGLKVPAGRYRALKITIGDGGGRNWWCVLYPSLCRLNEALDENDPAGILAWLKSRFGGEQHG